MFDICAWPLWPVMLSLARDALFAHRAECATRSLRQVWSWGVNDEGALGRQVTSSNTHLSGQAAAPSGGLPDNEPGPVTEGLPAMDPVVAVGKVGTLRAEREGPACARGATCAAPSQGAGEAVQLHRSGQNDSAILVGLRWSALVDGEEPVTMNAGPPLNTVLHRSRVRSQSAPYAPGTGLPIRSLRMQCCANLS